MEERPGRVGLGRRDHVAQLFPQLFQLAGEGAKLSLDVVFVLPVSSSSRNAREACISAVNNPRLWLLAQLDRLIQRVSESAHPFVPAP